MIQKFTTKRDTNGNRYTLIIDHEKKRYYPDYNTTSNYTDYITITKTDRQKMMDHLDENGYQVTIKL